MSAALPSFDDLPIRPDLPPRSSWGVWGDEDKLGTLNLLTPERVAAGIAAVQENRAISLDLPLDLISPPLFGRKPLVHTVLDLAVGHDEMLSDLNPQASSQWDGFRHVKHPSHGFYNGIPDEEHSVDFWAQHGIAGRAVLVDVGRYRAEIGRPVDCAEPDVITVSDLDAAMTRFGVTVQQGDILLMRTGWTTWYRSLDESTRAELSRVPTRQVKAPGLVPGEDTARFLWDLHIAAIASDNPSIEQWPRGWPQDPDVVSGMLQDPAQVEAVFLHSSLIPLLGLPLGELWDLDELADACAARGDYSFLLVSSPLRHAHGVGSTANATAIV